MSIEIVARGCRMCGVPLAQSRRQFCSQRCSGQSRRARVELVCPVCSTVFEVHRYEAEQKARRYCSKECKNAQQSTQLARVCEVCATPFTTIPSIAALGQGRFCSRACRDVARLKRPPESRACAVCQ